MNKTISFLDDGGIELALSTLRSVAAASVLTDAKRILSVVDWFEEELRIERERGE